MRPTIVRVLVVAEDPIVRGALVARVGEHRIEAIDRRPSDARAYDVELWDVGASRFDPARARKPVVALLADDRAAREAIGHARGVITREASTATIAAALAAVAAGLVVIDPRWSPPPRSRASRASSSVIDEPLTAREIEVLQQLAAGLGNRAIAAALSISEHTVKFHVDALRNKLGARTRAEAVVEAARRGFLLL